MQRKIKKAQKTVDGSKFKIAIVATKFNEDIISGMLNGTLEALKENKVVEKNLEIIRVPGALEIPLACQRIAKTKKYQGIVALGCVIKGDTDHYYYVSQESIKGVMKVMRDFGIPIGVGIITTNNLKQAQDRSGSKNNKGAEAAQAMLEMV